MKSTITAAWSATGVAAASVVAITLGMGLQGGVAAAPLPGTAPLIASASARHDDPVRLTTLPAHPAVVSTSLPQEDVAGPCDEAEHAGDPACSGAAPPAREDRDAREDRRADDGREAGDDRRAGDRGRQDNNGRGSGHDDSAHKSSGH